MAAAYWVTTFREVRDQAKLDAYIAVAGPAIRDGGGRFLAMGPPVAAYESGSTEGATIIEFDSVDQAITTHDGPAYQEALRLLGDGAERDVRILVADRE